ncbi:MAG: glycosyltransferase family A protein [Archangium sp.]|nr:glycosyltransferase family A protein [Archangium sp.]
MPRVSILLPARNAARTIDVAVRSLLSQTFTDFELIAIDDGSSDDTGERLRTHARGDPRMQVHTGPGRGLIAALELGVPLCKGEFYARMDADDESLPRRLELSVAALDADPSLAGVGTGVEIFREDQPPSPNLIGYGQWLSSLTTPELLFREALVESPLCNPSTLVRREVLDRVGPWHEGDFPEDWQHWLRFLEQGHRLTCLPHVLHRWRDSDTRLTRTDARYRREAHLAIKTDFVSRRLGKDRGLVLWGAGDVGLKVSRLLRAKGHRIEQFVELHPRKIGKKLEGIPAIAPEQLAAPNERVHLLATVGAKGARAEIRAWLVERGWVEGRDFTCLA